MQLHEAGSRIDGVAPVGAQDSRALNPRLVIGWVLGSHAARVQAYTEAPLESSTATDVRLSPHTGRIEAVTSTSPPRANSDTP